MITPMKVSTVGAPLTCEVEALGERALEALDERWSGAVSRLTFSGWLRGQFNTLETQRKGAWTKIFQLYKPQRIQAGNHEYNAYRFVLLAAPELPIEKPEDFDTPAVQALLSQSIVYTCFLVLDNVGDKIISLINPLF